MQTHSLGFPRIGLNRELKWATEEFWQGRIAEEHLLVTAKGVMLNNWRIQKEAGIDLVPAGDFSLYDHMLDMTATLGAIPKRFGFSGDKVDLDIYFRMARGSEFSKGAPAMEMTKWFDTNYHYIVPEFWPGQSFHLSYSWFFDQIREARRSGINAKAVIPGPFTYIHLGKSMDNDFDRWEHLDKIISVYAELIELLGKDCQWIQIDEPILVLDLDRRILEQMIPAYERLARAAGDARIMIATYFGEIADPETVCMLPVSAIHLDLVRAPAQLEAVLEHVPDHMVLSLGVINGRNIWRADLDRAVAQVDRARRAIGEERVMVAPSCSLLHVPIDLSREKGLDPEIKSWMAFAREKCIEVRTVADAISGRPGSLLIENRRIWEGRRRCRHIVNSEVRQRLASLTSDMLRRNSPFPERRKCQDALLHLPLFPTTTIGSFPQTREIRSIRKRYIRGEVDQSRYTQIIKEYIKFAVEVQEKAGLDVLVHGEAERNDMVEYFAGHMDGFCLTENGWVQSYGTRCVKPPIICGDVSRPAPITVGWSTYAQSLTQKPMKGMLTGPVTILRWSFARDDQPERDTCRQIALAIRDEVCDLERAGMKIIQIDEPAFREGLPLRRNDWAEYLEWAVGAFRLATSGVKDQTQIHTHMCYSEFNEIIGSIAEMDADVISIEASRSRMALLEAFGDYQYPNDIGPGIIDIHSPRIPTVDELIELLHLALEVIPPERLWVNPDCGLKTRNWPEVEAMLQNLTTAAVRIRERIETQKNGVM